MSIQKFRIWHNLRKEWLFGYELLGGFSLLGETVLLGELGTLRLEELNDLVVMQSTGLLDENGIEIYEHDIVDCASADSIDRYVVEYDKELAAWTLVNVDGFTLGGHTYHGGELLHAIGHDMLDVVGNVYQHPELLNE